MRSSIAEVRAERQGFALLFVLWLLVLLALVAAHLTATGSRESRIARNLVSGAQTEAAADGAVYDAIFRLATTGLTGERSAYRTRIGGLPVGILLSNETAKINPNTAPAPVLSALLQAATGMDAGTAATIAQAIVDWRSDDDGDKTATARIRATYLAAGKDYAPPHERFRSLDELGEVLGMNPALAARLAPHLSLYAPEGAAAPSSDPVVTAARAVLPAAGGVTPPAQVVAIDVRADGPDGAVFLRHAVVRLIPDGTPSWRLLAWDRPSAPIH
jgi:general secretion pathway protein K